MRTIAIYLLVLLTLVASAQTFITLHNNSIARGQVTQQIQQEPQVTVPAVVSEQAPTLATTVAATKQKPPQSPIKVAAPKQVTQANTALIPVLTPPTTQPTVAPKAQPATPTQTTSTTPNTTVNTNTGSTNTSGNTTATVAQHATQGDCWIIISGSIYDVTQFLNTHPGGVGAITAYCGRDATLAFQTHGRTGGSNHSSYAYSLLPSYFVSTLSSGIVTTPSTSTYTISTAKSGAGSGTISGSGISCGTTCTATVNAGTSVILTATPTSGSTFTGWTGACSGTGSCTIVINANQSVAAAFDVTAGAVSNVTLSVSAPGGTVTSNPSGISCGATCSATFPVGTVVTLTSTPTSGYAFSAWSGACSGSGVCTFTIQSNTSVAAGYTATGGTGGATTYTTAQVATHNTQGNCWIVISSKAYDVTSWINSHPGGANAIISRCGTDATTVFTTNGGGGHAHSSYAYSLLPSYYVGDIGAATPPPYGGTTYAVTIAKSGAGSGTVSGSGISCGATCSTTVNAGTAMTLTAATASGSTFTGWSGACSGTGTCALTVNANQNVTATFATAAGGGGGGGTPATYTIHVTSAGNYDTTSLTLNVDDSITFIYTPPISGEVITAFSPAGVSSLTLDAEFTQRTKTFAAPGTWTFRATDHNGNSGTIVVQ